MSSTRVHQAEGSDPDRGQSDNNPTTESGSPATSNGGLAAKLLAMPPDTRGTRAQRQQAVLQMQRQYGNAFTAQLIQQAGDSRVQRQLDDATTQPDALERRVQAAHRHHFSGVNAADIVQWSRELALRFDAESSGSSRRGQLARLLVDMYYALDGIISHAASEQMTELPRIEGIEWDESSPLAGLTADISPFQMLDLWVAELPDVPQRRRRRPQAQSQTQPASSDVQGQGGQISGRIRGAVSLIRQPNPNACWATVATMMASYRDHATYSEADIPIIVGRAGSRYKDNFAHQRGLASSDKGPFLAAMGLQSEPAQTLTPQGIAELLNSVGPIWVTTDGGSLDSVHARIIVSIGGDGSADGTLLEIVDPHDGALHTETYRVFSTRFENVARGDIDEHPNSPNPFRAQIVHW